MCLLCEQINIIVSLKLLYSMKNLRKLFLITLAPAFVLFVSWVLSTYNEFVWKGVVFLALVFFVLQIILCFTNPKKLIEPVPGFMISGSLFAFISADMCGEYRDVFVFFAMIMLAFTLFFVSIPYILKKRE